MTSKSVLALLLSASVFSSGRLWAQPAPPDQAAQVDARKHYERGMKLFQDGDFKLALIEVTRAYELAPAFRILYNVGQINLQLNNYSAALVAFERYLKEGGEKVPAKRRAEVEREIVSLRGRTAHIQVVVNVEGADVTIDGVPVAKTPVAAPLLVDAGQHTVRVELEGRTPASRFVTLAGGDNVKLEFQLEAPPTTPVVAPPSDGTVDAPAGTTLGGPRPVQVGGPSAETRGESRAWIGWVGTGALAAGTAVVGVLALGSIQDLDDARRSPSTTREQFQSAQREAEMLALTTDILAGATIVAGAVSLYFTLSSSPSAPKVGVAPGRLQVQARF